MFQTLFLLQKLKYRDVAKKAASGKKAGSERGGVWGWLESWFGIVPSMDEKEKEYRLSMSSDLLKEEYLDALEGRTYPTRLYPICVKELSACKTKKREYNENAPRRTVPIRRI